MQGHQAGLHAEPDAAPLEVSGETRGRIGRVLANRWTIDAVVGIGGTGTVYAASHRNGSRVAIKILHEHLCRNVRAKQRFIREGYVANRIPHAGVVNVLDDGEDTDGSSYLVMELLSGESAAERIRASGPLRPDVVAETGVKLLDVLAAAHATGVVHRDVKPSNIFFERSGALRLLDFGVARVQCDVGFDTLHTESEAILGTPAFMPPELAAGREHDVDALTDIWSVGATLFQLATGRSVHAARTRNEAIVAAATLQAPPARSVEPTLPAELAAVIDRALSFERSRRWPNARAMAAALQSAAGMTPDLVPEPENTLPEERRSAANSRFDGRGSGRVRWLIGAVAAVAAVGVVTGLGLHHRQHTLPARVSTASAAPPLRVGRADVAENAPTITLDTHPTVSATTSMKRETVARPARRVVPRTGVSDILDRRN